MKVIYRELLTPDECDPTNPSIPAIDALLKARPHDFLVEVKPAKTDSKRNVLLWEITVTEILNP